jgi:GNAT superfamily N-acetyltransferase
VLPVADIQTEAFHEEHAFQPIDAAFKSFFRVRRLKHLKPLNALPAEPAVRTGKPAAPCAIMLHTHARACMQAEVLAAMRGKLAAAPGTYAILVAVPEAKSPGGEAIGVIEVFQEASRALRERVGASEGESGMGWLASMGVAESYRRQGVGRALVAASEEAVKGWGYRRTALHVFGDNEAAVKMYESCGFAQIESTPFVWMQWRKKRAKVLMHRPCSA